MRFVDSPTFDDFPNYLPTHRAILRAMDGAGSGAAKTGRSEPFSNGRYVGVALQPRDAS